jgi:hypothetical protein
VTIDAGATPTGSRTFPDALRRSLYAGPPVYVLSPPPALLAESVLALFADPPVDTAVEPPVRVVTTPSVRAECLDTFRVGQQAAELVDSGLLGFRTAETLPVSGPLVVGEDGATTAVTFGDAYALFDAADRGVARVGRDRAREAYEAATPLSVPDRPRWRAVASDLRDRSDEATLSALVALLDARRSAPAARTLDVPTVALLAGAGTTASQKAIARWCVEHDVAAKSTVSTRKQRLVERGLLETVPVAGSVGAPVHRLAFADDHLRALSPAERYAVAADVLTAE